MSIPRYQLSKRDAGRASHSGAGTHWCVPSRTRAETGRDRPIDIDRSPGAPLPGKHPAAFPACKASSISLA
ncbi:MAG UNVERIFIED_CONTAM: hypothetical protein LVR18_16065 [Planctomycetaceae bacterium]